MGQYNGKVLNYPPPMPLDQNAINELKKIHLQEFGEELTNEEAGAARLLGITYHQFRYYLQKYSAR